MVEIYGAAKIAGLIANFATDNGTVLDDSEAGKNKRSLLLTNGSITRLIGNMIIEPKIVVISSLKNEDVIEDIIKRQTATFCGIYTMAFKHICQNLGMSVNTALNLLGTAETKLLDLANNAMTLQHLDGDSIVLNDTLDDLTFEAAKHDSNDGEPFVHNIDIELNFEETRNSDGTVATQSRRLVIPVIVKASVKYVSAQDMKLLLDNNGSYENSFNSRLDDAKSGAISWGQFFFPTDLIEKYRRNKLRDENEVLKDLRDMEDEAHSKLLTEGAIGFGKYYRMLLIDEAFKTQLQYALGDKLTKKNIAQKALNSMNSLSLTVVNTDLSMCRTFTKDISGDNTYTFRSLKKKDKDDSTKEILAYLAGTR